MTEEDKQTVSAPAVLPADARQVLADQLVEQAKTDGISLIGPGGLLSDITKRVLETGLEVELTDHLGYEKHSAEGRNGGNSRNGSRPKTVVTDVGPVTLDVPRDRDGTFDPALVEASAELVARRWRPNPFPEWVTCIPSTRHPALVPAFAQALAERLGVRFHSAVVKIGETEPQKDMENSQQQLRNVHAAFDIVHPLEAPVLLVDDIVDSRWTLTVVGALLRRAGVPCVYPFALARSTGK